MALRSRPTIAQTRATLETPRTTASCYRIFSWKRSIARFFIGCVPFMACVPWENEQLW
ncbi:MAG: hypothetical protein HC895_04750 [Leptolyngbyaceae cyanobacterium SM1_3_5]|nr:hypothetical protein [Leptolyngbyaceae cyanobacterium SM1_3_5]